MPVGQVARASSAGVSGRMSIRHPVKLGREAHVLRFLADRQRQLVVGHDDARRPRLQVDDLDRLDPAGESAAATKVAASGE